MPTIQIYLNQILNDKIEKQVKKLSISKADVIIKILEEQLKNE